MEDANYGCMIKSQGISFVEQLLIGRYHLITKIHQNKINRLGNYLMALSFREAIKEIKKEEVPNVIDSIFNMNDYEFYSFLKTNLKEKFKPLNNFLMGNSDLKQLFNFDYLSLSPMARFNAEDSI
jgi:HD superfamily phosphohydrolase